MINYKQRFISTFIIGIPACLLAQNIETRPNILIVLADDYTFSDIGCYGGQSITPNIDNLAKEGMQFNRCFQQASVCSPTRHALYTGMYPIKTGAYPNHTFVSRPNTISIAQRLQSVGYNVALSGKTHIGTREVFPFEYLPDPINFPKQYEFITSSQKASKPFCLIMASHFPHAPWIDGDRSLYDAQKLKLPPMWMDTPEIRQEFLTYLAECTDYDREVGEALKMLSKKGVAKNTIVIVLSEQGTSSFRAKHNLYDRGIQSACIVRWPDVVKPNSKTDAMVEYVDIVPTLLDITKVPITNEIDGKSFLPVLLGKTNTHKKYVFAEYTNRGIKKASDHYGMRSVRSERYKYIYNFTPNDPYYNGTTVSLVYKSWEKAGKQGDSTAAKIAHDYVYRPEVELYDIVADPEELNNIAGDPKNNKIKAELKAELDAWMKSQGDLGQETEMDALNHQGKGQKE